MQNPSPSPTVLSFPPQKTYTPVAKGPGNLNRQPGDTSVTDPCSRALGGPPRPPASLEKDTVRDGLWMR